MKWSVLVACLAACSFGDNTIRQHGEVPDAAIHQADAPDSQDDAMVAPPPDAPSPPACSVLPQSGCAAPTPACDLTAADDGTLACREVTHQGVSNSHCPADTDCKTGYTCVHGDTAAEVPWCARFCGHDSDCLGVGSRCVDPLVDNAGNDLGIDVCSNACNPYSQSGCPSGMGCLGSTDPGGNFSDCEYMSNTPDGQACTHSTDCRTGSTCVNDGGTSQCESYCLVGDDTTCLSGLACDGFVTPLMIGTVEYGACH